MPDTISRPYLPGVMMINRAGRFVSTALVGAGLSLTVSCAQLGAPQGGPADAVAPMIESTSPKSGEALVARDAKLAIQFSEPVDKKSLESAIQISPSRTGRATYKWSSGGRHLSISWPDTLREATSYRVTLSNRIADRRGNKLAEPYTFAFSTGAQVDKGEIRGAIRTADGKPQVFDVFAYRLESMPDTFWLSPPDYSTQSAADGHFQVPFLRGGTYRLLVLTDANRNQHLDHTEQFALATRDLVVGDEIPPDSVNVYAAVYDTVPFTLRSCISAGPKLIVLLFSHPIDTAGSLDWDVGVHDSSTVLAVKFGLLKPSQRRPSAITLSGDWQPGVTYSISLGNVFDQRGRQLVTDTCHCTHSAASDSLGPKIESVFFPTVAEGMGARDPIIWTFSEPIDDSRLSGAGSVHDSAGVAVSGEWNWNDAQTLAFSPQLPWPDTILVVASLDSTKLADVSGNPAAAAATYTWKFRALGEDQLGVLEGRIETSLSSLPEYWIEARGVGNARKARVHRTGPGDVSMTLPSGRWQLTGFVDSNKDGRWFPGSVDPFAIPELRSLSVDTVDVRARFTIEDIILRF